MTTEKFGMERRAAEYERRLMKRPARDDEHWTTTYRWVPGRELDEATRRVMAEMMAMNWYTLAQEPERELGEVLWTVS